MHCVRDKNAANLKLVIFLNFRASKSISNIDYSALNKSGNELK